MEKMINTWRTVRKSKVNALSLGHISVSEYNNGHRTQVFVWSSHVDGRCESVYDYPYDLRNELINEKYI